MKTVTLTAAPRTMCRRSGVKKLRANGHIPAVIYGRNRPAQNLQLKAKELEDLIHHSVSENLLVDLIIEGDNQPKRLALLQEVQHNPLTGRILHVDFHEVAEDEKVIIQVAVETVGEPVGVKTEGGVLEHVLFRIKVRALPKDLPERIDLDVSNLRVGQAIHLGDIQPPPGVEILGDKHITVVAVAAPRKEEEVAAVAEPVAAGEVEMIKEKKEEPGEGEAAPEKGEKAAKPEKAEKAEKAAKPEKAEKAEKKK